MQKYIILIIVLISAMGLSAQSVSDLYQQSIQRYDKADYEGFLQLNRQLLGLRPNNPTVTYNLAAAYALTEQPDSALLYLKRFISTNATTPFEEDEDWAPISNLPAFKDLMVYATGLQEGKQLSDRFMEIPLSGFHTEDITINRRKQIFLSDVHHGQVLKYQPRRDKIDTLATLPISAMALENGRRRNHLWVSGSMMPQFHLYDSTNHYVSALYLIHTRKKQILHTIAMPGQHVFGAMCRAGKDAIYLTDSHEPIIYRLDEKTRTVEEWLRLEDAINLQGISYDAATQSLWVADYLKGIARVDLLDKSYHWLMAKDYSLRGIDGLAYTKNGLLAIQNGSKPQRLVRFQYQDQVITQIDILDNDLQTGGEPTNGCLIPEGFVYITNSPWPHYTPDNKAILQAWKNLVLHILPL